jgi:hypothetical protein
MFLTREDLKDINEDMKEMVFNKVFSSTWSRFILKIYNILPKLLLILIAIVTIRRLRKINKNIN